MSTEREPLLRGEDEDDGNRVDDEQLQYRNRIQNGKFTLLEKVLFTLAVVFFITLCVLAGLYSRRVYEEKPRNPPSVINPPPGSNISGVS